MIPNHPPRTRRGWISLVFGAAVGFGRRLNARKSIDGLAGPTIDTPESPDWRVLAVVAGTAAVFFVPYLLLEYVAATLIRALAA